MKEIKFKTSKGEFYVADEIKYLDNEHFFAYKLSEITEEQASEIVDNALFDIHFRDYCFTPTLDNTFSGEFRLNTAIESLHSLLKSQGIYLFENPFSDKLGIVEFDYHRNKAEAKTFYNPYIFKLND